MARQTKEVLQSLRDYIDELAPDLKDKCALCNETLTHIVKKAEVKTGAGTKTVATMLAEKINETAAPQDKVSGKRLTDRVRGVEGKRKTKSDIVTNKTVRMLPVIPEDTPEEKKAMRIEAREQKEYKQQEKASGRFRLVYADPPWRYDFSETTSREIENQYPTATVDEIISHSPETADDCVLFLWATVAKLIEALEVMEGWGFKYKTMAVWDKEKIGMGYWFRGQHEMLLVGTKGAIAPPEQGDRVSSVFREKRGKHSKKPLSVVEWLESAFPDLNKLEMYSRDQRNGWEVWGNES